MSTNSYVAQPVDWSELIGGFAVLFAAFFGPVYDGLLSTFSSVLIALTISFILWFVCCYVAYFFHAMNKENAHYCQHANGGAGQSWK